MDLNEIIKQIVIDQLKNINLVFLNEFAHKNHEIITFLYNQKIIDDQIIKFALEEAVINYGFRYYNLITNKKSLVQEYPDHLPIPEILSYSLNKNLFSKKHIAKIKFDHGDNLETFIKKYDPTNLLETFRKELLNPRPLFKDSGGYWDPHPACCH